MHVGLCSSSSSGALKQLAPTAWGHQLLLCATRGASVLTSQSAAAAATALGASGVAEHLAPVASPAYCNKQQSKWQQLPWLHQAMHPRLALHFLSHGTLQEACSWSRCAIKPSSNTLRHTSFTGPPWQHSLSRRGYSSSSSSSDGKNSNSSSPGSSGINSTAGTRPIAAVPPAAGRNSATGSTAEAPTSASSASSASSSSSAAAAAAAAAQQTKQTQKQLHVPPAVAAGAQAAAAGASRVLSAAAQQVSRVIRLVQQTSLSRAAGLELSSLWQHHSGTITAAAAAAAVAGIYHVSYMAAGTVIDMSSPAASYYCLAASTAAVAAAGLYARSALVVDPERVYQVAMRKLTQHAGLQEVMGTPLAGSPLRIQLVTKGSFFITDNLMLQRRAPRIHMLFPLAGPVKSGVVSVQAKKAKAGKYAFKTLVVELPDKELVGAAGRAAAAAAAAATSTAAAQPAGSSGSSRAEAGGNPAGNASAHSSNVANYRQSNNSTSSSGIIGSSSGGSSCSSTAAARIYVIGKPSAAGNSSSSVGSAAAGPAAAAAGGKPGPPSAEMLLEQLQQPLVFAMQQNVVVYETEDGLESELGYESLLDQEQLTVLDRAKQGAVVVIQWSKAAGCLAVQQLGKVSKAVLQATRQALSTLRKPPTAAPGTHKEAAASASKLDNSETSARGAANNIGVNDNSLVRDSSTMHAAAAPAPAPAPPSAAVEQGTGGNKAG